MGKFEYAPAPESRDVVALRESYGLFIDGDFVPGKGDGVFKTISPATEEVLAEVTEANPADVDRAVSAARTGLRADLVGHAGQGAGKIPVPYRADHPGTSARASRARVAGQRQADPRVP